jgi:hypothetical protein
METLSMTKREDSLERVDFQRYIPTAPDADAERRWRVLQAQRAAQERYDQRRARLDLATELEITDEMRARLLGDALDQTPSQRDAQRWAFEAVGRPWLALCGSTGCGKSVSLAWILAELGAVWISAERLNRVFSARYGDQYEEQELLRGCRLLLIDDVGTEREVALMLGALVELLESRKSARRRTAITTNLTPKAFVARYRHERLLSRVHESVEWSTSNGADLRRTLRVAP